MTQYIDKSAVVAEIDRRIKEIEEIGTYLSPKGILTNLLCYINTLEVKDIEDSQSLEKEVAKGKNIPIFKKILSWFFESTNSNDKEFSKAIENIENGLI